jgi:protein-tyrosine-phosphatase
MISTNQPFILIVGGANTGRSPIAVAFLRRMLEERQLDWNVESAGIIGYDDDPPDVQASFAMDSFGLDIESHRARSLTDELLETATIIIAIDSGIVHAIRGRFPSIIERTVTLGDLSGRQRDIPELFRMDITAWVSYAQEIRALLRDGLDTLLHRVYQACPDIAPPPPAVQPPPATACVDTAASHAGEVDEPDNTSSSAATSPAPVPGDTPAGGALPAADLEHVPLHAAVERCERLLAVMSDMPALIAWDNARLQLETEIATIAETSQRPGDMVKPYANILTTILRMCPELPSSEQLATLRLMIGHMRKAIDHETLTELSTILANWNKAG